MMTQDCGNANRALKAQDTALELFQVAALMLGNESEAVALVEETVATTEIDPCADAAAMRRLAQAALIESALSKLSQRDPAAFDAAGEKSDAASATCIESDDLSATGVSQAQLSELIAGGGREQLRQWLGQLPGVQRAIFVQRAVLGQDNVATAERLRKGIGARANGWTAENVSEVFRQALCSLATSLVNSATVKAPA